MASIPKDSTRFRIFLFHQFVDVLRGKTEYCFVIHDGDRGFDHAGIVDKYIQPVFLAEIVSRNFFLVFTAGFIEKIFGTQLEHSQ